MPAQPASARPPLAFDELPPRRRNLFYVFAVGRRANEQRSTQRYLKLFARFDKGSGVGRFFSWNWSAFFCTFPWLAFRRLPGFALLYFVLAYLLAPIQLFAWHRSCPGEMGLPFVVVAAWVPFTFLLMPAIADWLYYRRARRVAMEAYEKRFEEKIGTSASTAAQFVVGGAVVFLVFFSTVGSYRPVSHRVELADVVRAAVGARNAVDEFHARHGRLPGAGEVGPFSTGPKVRSTTVDDRGVVTAVSELRGFEGKSIVYTPAVADGRIAWKCSTPDIDFRFLPAECGHRR